MCLHISRMGKITVPDADLIDAVVESLGLTVAPRVEMLSRGNLPDSAVVYGIGNYVAYVSPEAFPLVAYQGMEAAQAATRTLGQCGTDVILATVAEGEVEGRTFAVVPRVSALSRNRLINRAQRIYLSPAVKSWLRQLAAISSSPNSRADEQMTENLSAIASQPDLSRELRDEAARFVRRHDFIPRHTPMHGDLWAGNILTRGGRLVVIDWRGFREDGYAIYDLVRFAGSFSISSASLRVELEAHARTLCMDARDTSAYLLSALGHIRLNADQFPLRNFISLTERSWQIWAKAVGRG